jgi:hypothetical protein
MAAAYAALGWLMVIVGVGAEPAHADESNTSRQCLSLVRLINDVPSTGSRRARGLTGLQNRAASIKPSSYLCTVAAELNETETSPDPRIQGVVGLYDVSDAQASGRSVCRG